MASWFQDPTFLAVWVASALICAMLATTRLKEPVVTWAIIGVILGPIGVIWALLKKPR